MIDAAESDATGAPDSVETSPATIGDPPTSTATGHPRKRPKPGERRVQILQTLASMLDEGRTSPDSENASVVDWSMVSGKVLAYAASVTPGIEATRSNACC